MESESEPEIVVLPADHATFDFSFKLIIIGDSGVGKSSLTVKAVKNKFDENFVSTVGFEFFTFIVKIDNTVIKLQIWDTCGQEIYRSLITSFYRNSSLAFIVYSIDDFESFRNIETWIKDLKNKSSPNIKIFLIGNKCDEIEKRKVKYIEGEKLKNEHGIEDFFETSAKTGINIEEVFKKAANILFLEHKSLKLKNLNLINSETHENLRENIKFSNENLKSTSTCKC